jgi:O-antigen/teichoic acid export membrane protein
MSAISIYIDKAKNLKSRALSIWAHAGFQKYFRNTGWMFFGKIASMAISFIATAYIARNLGPTNYGELSYAISFVGLFGFLATLGIDQILYRDIIKFPEKKNEYIGTALFLRIISAFIAIIICISTAFIFSPKDVSLLLIFIISLSFIINPFQLLNYEFQAEAKARIPSIISLVIVLILNIIKIIIIFLNQGVIYLALAILLEPILYAIGFIYFKIKFYGNLMKLKFNKILAISILKDSFPLIFASAFFAIYARIDQVMIKNMINTESVGLYDAAVRISEIWYFIPNIIIISLFPAIVNARKNSSNLYYKRIKHLFIIILSISILTALFTSIYSKYLILIIFGSGFIGSLTVLNIYVWSMIGASLSFLSQQVLIAENMSKTISISIFFGMIINVILNIILIPKYGMIGAAMATLISYIVPFISLFFFKKTKQIIFNIIKNV